METQNYKKEKVLYDLEQILLYDKIKIINARIDTSSDETGEIIYYLTFVNHRNDLSRKVFNESEFENLTNEEYLKKLDIIATSMYYDFKDVFRINEPFALRKAIKNGLNLLV